MLKKNVLGQRDSRSATDTLTAGSKFRPNPKPSRSLRCYENLPDTKRLSCGDRSGRVDLILSFENTKPVHGESPLLQSVNSLRSRPEIP